MARDPKLDAETTAAPRPEDAAQVAITRRSFLTFAGLALSSSFIPVSLSALEGCNSGGASSPGGPQPDFTATLLRPTDLVNLALGFVNLKPSSDGKTLEPIRPGDPAYVLVDFDPQHLIEQVYRVGVDDKASPLPPPDGKAVQALLAGKSRVVFLVPAGKSLEYSVPGLLTAFSALDMSVPTLATPATGVTKPMSVTPSLRPASVPTSPANPGSPNAGVTLSTGPALPSAPTGWDTALEIPARLLLAPNQYGAWAHATSEVTSSVSGRTELWHTRLGVRVAGGVDESDRNAAARTVRAIWTRDPGFDPSKVPHPIIGPVLGSSDSTPWAALHDIDRASIVFESANFGTHSKPRTPSAIQVNRLMLTALGAWLDVRGDFGDTPASGLAEWQERATMGRDHYVKTVYTGVLYPWGHRTARVTLSERKLTNAAEALWQRTYLIVRQPTMTYDPGSDMMLTAQLRKFPFKQITITTLVTPDLLDVMTGTVPKRADNSQPYQFKMVGLDKNGGSVHFEAPAAWIETQMGQIPTGAGAPDPTAVNAAFLAASPVSPINGQRVAFAPELPPAAMSMSMSMPMGSSGSSTFETQSVSHNGWPASGSFHPGALPFVPQMDSAQVAVEALRNLGSLSDAVGVSYHDAFVANDFGLGSGANAGDLLFQLSKAAGVDFSAHSDSSGGFVAPNLPLSAISRALGPVGGADMGSGAAPDIATGSFDPKTFFDPSLLKGLGKAKIFGVLGLDQILPATGALANAPKFVTQALNTIDTIVADYQKLQALVQTLEKAASDQATALPMELQSAVDSLKTKANDLLTSIEAVIAMPGDTVNAGNAVTAITNLPTLLDQLASALDSANGKLPLGTASLSAQLRTIAGTVRQATQAVSSTFQAILDAYATGQNLLKNLTVKLDWQTPVWGFPSLMLGGKPDDIFLPTGGLVLDAELRLKAVDGRPAGLDLLCGLEAFDINLFGGSASFLVIKFEHLLFEMKAGQKGNVDAKLAKPGMVFEGPLSFVQTLTSIIPLDGFSDPPGISISAKGIEASFSIGLPTLAVGIFSLSNISIGAGFKIPFIGDPLSVSFDFCTRDNPFVLTVSFLGGGGFFGITINPNGVEVLEASFEFGAGIAVDFGVASGSVSAMAGIYFKMEFDATAGTDDATLTGFFRMRGEVDVLGIITASIELYLELTYESSTGKVTGTATLDIDVSVFFFHASVSITAQKRFGGGNGDPSFADVMQPANANDVALPAPFQTVVAEGGAAGPGQLSFGYDPWADYLGAFAA